MKTWTIYDAKDRFTEVVQSCSEEPQIVYDHGQPVGVMIGVTLFNELIELQHRQPRPTIAELLDELTDIMEHEPVEIEIPDRQDRSHPLIEATDEVFV